MCVCVCVSLVYIPEVPFCVNKVCAAFLGLCLAVQLLSSGTVTFVPQTVSNIYGYEENHKGSKNRQQDPGIFQCTHQSLLRRAGVGFRSVSRTVTVLLNTCPKSVKKIIKKKTYIQNT